MRQQLKRIAHYAPNLWAPGGISNYVRRLGRAQSSAGIEVTYFTEFTTGGTPAEGTVVVPPGARELFAAAADHGVDILHLHKPVSFLPENRVPTVRTMHGNQGSCPSGTRYLAKSRKPCDRRYSVQGCAISHLSERCGSLRPSKFIRHFARIRQEQSLGSELPTFTVSRYLRDQMVRNGFPDQRLHVLQSPAPDVPDEPVPPMTTGIPSFLFLGRLVPQKGIQWLMQAIAGVRKPVRLDVAGDGPLLQNLRHSAERIGISDRVVFHGWIDGNRISDLMAQARAVVVPSLWHEPAGLVTLEAAAHGRAVIASKVGGIPEYAGRESSILVDPDDVERLAGAIETLIEDPGLAMELGRKGRERALLHFSMSAFLKRQHELYERASC